jgi:hypothetical protein
MSCLSRRWSAVATASLPAWIMWQVNRVVATRSRLHTHQTITDHKRPTDHYRHISQLLTSNATSCPWKGVSCRGVLESHRYPWRRPPLSGFALRSSWRHQQPPSLAPALPPQPNLPRLRTPGPKHRTCPRRPIAGRLGNDLPTRTSALHSPGSVSSRRGSSTRFLHAPRKSSSKRRSRLRPLLPAPRTNSLQPLRSQFRMPRRLRRPRHPRRPGPRSSAG